YGPGQTCQCTSRITPRSSHYKQVVVAPHLNKSREEISAKPIRFTAGSGARSQTASTDLEEGDSASTTLGIAFPPRVFLRVQCASRNKKFELHSGNVACY